MLVAAPTYQIIDQDPARIGAWMRAQGSARYREGCTAIGLERDGEIVAAALFDCWNGPSIFGHIAISGTINRDWLRRISHYPFVQCGCQMVIGLVPSANLKARRFDEHFGFKLQCTLSGGDPDGDLLIYTLQREDCRFLGR